ncbi:MAG: TRAP transporter substrate-binding protein DctP [Hyphomicrobiales bacterium]|nr:TRAP transporter substrate-binding protein DctP [Hyphomicrobiales bacterium]
MHRKGFMHRKGLAVAIALSTGLGAGLFAGAAQAATEIVFNVFTGPRHFLNDPIKAWAKDITAKTSGRVTFKFLPTNAAPPPKQIDAVVSGQFDGAFIFHGFTARRAVGPQFGILPFLQNTPAEVSSAAYYNTWKKFFGDKKEFARVGIRILTMFQFTGGNFHSGDETPITSIAEMKKRKMWALAGANSRLLKAAGVNHVSGPAARVNEFTQTNVVDGLATMTNDAVRAFGAMSFVKRTTITKSKMSAASFALFVSEKKWKQISAEDQKIILALSGEKLAAAVGKRSDRADDEAAVAMKKAGIKFINDDGKFEAELRKVGAPLIANWISAAKKKGVDGQAVIDMYVAEQKRLSGGK